MLRPLIGLWSEQVIVVGDLPSEVGKYFVNRLLRLKGLDSKRWFSAIRNDDAFARLLDFSEDLKHPGF